MCRPLTDVSSSPPGVTSCSAGTGGGGGGWGGGGGGEKKNARMRIGKGRDDVREREAALGMRGRKEKTGNNAREGRGYVN